MTNTRICTAFLATDYGFFGRMIYAMSTGFLSRSSRSQSDPLSDVLALLKPQAYKSIGLDAAGAWALQLGRTDGFLCCAVLSGHCWLIVEDLQQPLLLKPGEFAVLPRAPKFRMASEPSVPAADMLSVVSMWPKGGIIQWQGGGDCLLLSAFFTFASEHANLLSAVLPPLLHLDASVDLSALHWCLQRMMEVIREPQPGSVLQAEYLAQLMLLEVLRTQATGTTTKQIGWLSALANPQLGTAITAMHQRPGHRWTVQELAECAGMSRSTFAEHFKAHTGVAVMDYLIRWRMLLAADRLTNSQEPVSAIASSLGYESESAFGFAFKREMGTSPRQYAKSRINRQVHPGPSDIYRGYRNDGSTP